jgi:large subunit ribosomal protein L19
MDQLIHKFEAQYLKEEVPVLKTGYQVAVHQKIREGNKERIQIFKGIVIAVTTGQGINGTFTVRKISHNIGVEKVYPLHSPNIVKIEVLRAHKVRRAKINFLRELSGKALRLPEVPLKLTFKKFAKAVAPAVEAKTEEAKAE